MSIAVDSARLAIVVATLRNITPRSREVLSAYFSSATMEEAADRAGLARRTLDQHVRRFHFVTGLRSEEARSYFVAAIEAGG